MAADLYCIERLKKICEKMILGSIDVENAATVFQASDMHGARTLREASLNFIIDNFDFVSKSESLKAMARANVELLLEILDNK